MIFRVRNDKYFAIMAIFPIKSFVARPDQNQLNYSFAYKLTF